MVEEDISNKKKKMGATLVKYPEELVATVDEFGVPHRDIPDSITLTGDRVGDDAELQRVYRALRGWGLRDHRAVTVTMDVETQRGRIEGASGPRPFRQRLRESVSMLFNMPYLRAVRLGPLPFLSGVDRVPNVPRNQPVWFRRHSNPFLQTVILDVAALSPADVSLFVQRVVPTLRRLSLTDHGWRWVSDVYVVDVDPSHRAPDKLKRLTRRLLRRRSRETGQDPEQDVASSTNTSRPTVVAQGLDAPAYWGRRTEDQDVFTEAIPETGRFKLEHLELQWVFDNAASDARSRGHTGQAEVSAAIARRCMYPGSPLSVLEIQVLLGMQSEQFTADLLFRVIPFDRHPLRTLSVRVRNLPSGDGPTDDCDDCANIVRRLLALTNVAVLRVDVRGVPLPDQTVFRLPPTHSFDSVDVLYDGTRRFTYTRYWSESEERFVESQEFLESADWSVQRGYSLERESDSW